MYFHLKNSTFHELQVLIELIFWYNFKFSIFILQESWKKCLIFSYFSLVFEKWLNLLHQELLFKHIQKNVRFLNKCYVLVSDCLEPLIVAKLQFCRYITSLLRRFLYSNETDSLMMLVISSNLHFDLKQSMNVIILKKVLDTEVTPLN